MSVRREGFTLERTESTCAICDRFDRAGRLEWSFSSNTISPQGSCWWIMSQQSAAAREIE